jgi:cysteinyl-tRNA synthetase
MSPSTAGVLLLLPAWPPPHRIFYIYQTMADVEAVLEGAGEAGAAAAAAVAAGQAGAGRELLSVLVEGLLDDINTPQCVSGLSGPLKTINDLLTTKAGRKNPQR